MEMLSLKVETFVDKIPMLHDMFMEHREELTTNKKLMVLKPFIPAYETMEAAGKLVSIFVYDADKIVGYSINILTPHLHYSDMIMGTNDILYLNKEYREGPLGLRLIRKTEDEMKLRGVDFMLWHAKEDTVFSKILQRKGYKVQEIMYSKVLKD